MKAENIRKFEGGAPVAFELITGLQAVVKITSVDVDTQTITCSKPRVMVPVPQNPNDPNSPLGVTMFPYGLPLGQPLFTTELMELDAAHIVTILNVPKQLEDMYVRETSGIISASAGTMDRLDAAARAAGSKIII